MPKGALFLPSGRLRQVRERFGHRPFAGLCFRRPHFPAKKEMLALKCVYNKGLQGLGIEVLFNLSASISNALLLNFTEILDKVFVSVQFSTLKGT